jgi:hypothetical protein
MTPADSTSPLLPLVATGIISITTAIVAAWFTVRFSLRQFYSQKWWERKADAYSRIVEQLAYLKHDHLLQLRDEYSESELSDEQRREIAESSREIIVKLEEAAAIGAYVLSDQAITAIERLINALKKQRYGDFHYVEAMEMDFDAVDQCLTDIREYAKKDLALTPWWQRMRRRKKKK